MDKPPIRIFAALQMCCSGDDCCSAPGQTQKEIDNLADAVRDSAPRSQLEVNDIRDARIIDKFPAAAQLFKKYAYNALPIVMVGNDIVSYGISDNEFIINSINKFKKE